MRLLFVNRFYWPEIPATGQLLTDLAEHLAREGHEVNVICSGPRQPAFPREEVRHGVRIWRTRGTRTAGGGLIGRALEFARFHASALLHLLELTDRDTTVIALTDPPLVGIAAWLVTAVRRARLVHWVQDIYPELAIELAGQSWLRVLRPLRDAAWRRANHCVTLGTDMAAVLARAGVTSDRHSVIPNWPPAGLHRQPRTETSPLREAWGLAGKFVVGYSGNLGRVHDLDSILAAAEAVRGDPAIAFVFIGGGAQRATLEIEARRRQLPNVSFHSASARESLAATLAVADVHLVTLRAGCEQLVFPSKLYGVAAIGRPVIFVGPPASEIARQVHSGGLGGVAAPGDIPAIAAAIRHLKANRPAWDACAEAAVAFAAEHDFPAAGSRWLAILAQVDGCQPAALQSNTLPVQ
jgi:glycosyltransferase involved in cell wall biosynthesis